MIYCTSPQLAQGVKHLRFTPVRNTENHTISSVILIIILMHDLGSCDVLLSRLNMYSPLRAGIEPQGFVDPRGIKRICDTVHHVSAQAHCIVWICDRMCGLYLCSLPTTAIQFADSASAHGLYVLCNPMPRHLCMARMCDAICELRPLHMACICNASCSLSLYPWVESLM